MSTDAAYNFLLRFAEARGAAVEEGPDQALAILPPALQAELGAPETLPITSDPEVADEEGAVLLTPGHPVLERAVSATLRAGDSGLVWLPWPRPLPPDPGVLLARARQRIPVEHGRIDPAGTPAPVFVPLLRVGALCTHTLDEQFQERLEAWVDARTGLSLPEAQIRRWREVPGAEGGDALHPILQPRLDVALAAADALLQERAAVRGEELARQAQAARRGERERVEAYYAAVLAAAARRREGAPPERQALLDRQAEVTAAERERRLLEIADKFRPRHDLQRFRLHLLLAPAIYFPVWVRRGERRFPFALCWSLHAGDFVPAACPRCGSEDALSAGREALGCARCLPPHASRDPGGGAAGSAEEPDRDMGETGHRQGAPPRVWPARRNGTAAGTSQGMRSADATDPPEAACGREAEAALREAAVANAGATETGGAVANAGAAPNRVRHGQTAAPSTPAPRSVGATRKGAPGQQVAAMRSGGPGGFRPDPDVAHARHPAAPGRTRPAVPLDRGGRPAARGATPGDQGERLRQQAAFAFLRSLAAAGVPPAAAIARQSPLAVATALWGRAGPLLTVGLPLGVPPDEARLGPIVEDPLLPCAVSGALRAGRTLYAFTLRWASAAPVAAFSELLPCRDCFGPALPPRGALRPEVATRLFEGAPPPRGDLDPVEEALWDKARPNLGLPFFLRCVASWRRLRPGERESGGGADAAAAGLVHVVGRMAALRPTYTGLAKDFGVDAAAVRASATQLNRALQLFVASPW